MIVSDGRHAVAALNPQILDHKISGLMHAGVEFGKGVGLTLARFVIINQKGLVGRCLGMQRQQIAEIAKRHFVHGLRHAVLDMRPIQVFGSRGIQHFR